VQKLAGHSSPVTTAKYDRGEETKRLAVERLSILENNAVNYFSPCITAPATKAATSGTLRLSVPCGETASTSVAKAAPTIAALSAPHYKALSGTEQ